MAEGPLELFATPDRIIGREEQLTKIDAALRLPDRNGAGGNPPQGPGASAVTGEPDDVSFPDRRVLYFVGDGGVGKSRLLREVAIRGERRPGTLVIALIDLFLPQYFQPLALMETIADGVVAALRRYAARPGDPPPNERRAVAADLAATAFADYKREVDQYRRRAGASLDPVRWAFLASYSTVAAANFALVLLVDTFEKLNPDIEGTEKYNFRQGRKLEAWLLTLFGALPATLIAIAGRPVPRQEAAISERLPGRIQKIPVGTFSPPEVREFVEDRLSTQATGVESPAPGLASPEELPEKFYQDLFKISSGRPVILAIAVALWKVALIDLIDVSNRLLSGYPENLELLSDRIFTFIAKNLEDRAPQAARFLMKAAYLRRGITLELLAAIAEAEDSHETHEREFDLFKSLVFVKNHDGTLLTLHDEMYELLFNEPLLVRYNPLRWYQVARVYAERAQRAPAAADAAGLVSRAQRQARQLDLLFYRLAADPRDGYQLYRELSYNAIIAKEIDYDDQLQYELARFFDRTTSWGEEYRRQLALRDMPWTQVAFDENVRWLHRRYQTSDRNRFQRVVELADDLAKELPQASGASWQLAGALALARLESERFLAADRVTVTRAYSALIEDLDSYRARLRGEAAVPDRQQATLLLAIALNDCGYYERTRFHLNTAERFYQRSRRYLEELNQDSTRLLRAYVLNNLGYAQGQQGNAGQGLYAVDRALAIFRDEGVILSQAIAQNTRAQLLADQTSFSEALSEVAQAKRIFEEEGEQALRNLALAFRAEGSILRRIAERDMSPADSEQRFEQAIHCYHRAIELSELSELNRRIQARQELGATYRNRGFQRARRGDRAAAEEDWRAALDAFQAALVVYYEQPSTGPYDLLAASLHQDIAVVYYNLGQYGDAMQALRQARELIPRDYDIVEGVGLTTSSQTEELLSYWLRLGLIEFYWARLLFRLRSQDPSPDYLEPCTALMRALACARRYGARSLQLELMSRFGLEDLALIGDADTLLRLEKRTRSAAVRLHIEAVHTEEMRPLFEQARSRLTKY